MLCRTCKHPLADRREKQIERHRAIHRNPCKSETRRSRTSALPRQTGTRQHGQRIRSFCRPLVAPPAKQSSNPATRTQLAGGQAIWRISITAHSGRCRIFAQRIGLLCPPRQQQPFSPAIRHPATNPVVGTGTPLAMGISRRSRLSSAQKSLRHRLGAVTRRSVNLGPGRRTPASHRYP